LEDGSLSASGSPVTATTAAELCRVVLESVDGFRADQVQHDDMTLVIARVLPAG
jgi:serine phosphatase RsbU (regulator of sigma subunit)